MFCGVTKSRARPMTQTQTQTHLFEQDCRKSITTYRSCAPVRRDQRRVVGKRRQGVGGGGGGGERKEGEKVTMRDEL